MCFQKHLISWLQFYGLCEKMESAADSFVKIENSAKACMLLLFLNISQER